jgi:hypothetical protein
MSRWRNHIDRARHGCKRSYHRGARVAVKWGETLTEDLRFNLSLIPVTARDSSDSENGVEEKFRKFTENGSELYAKPWIG